MNTTKKVCVGLGQTDEEGKKFAKFDDIVEKVNAAKTTPDSSGTYHDYIELLKLYDKNSNGTINHSLNHRRPGSPPNSCQDLPQLLSCTTSDQPITIIHTWQQLRHLLAKLKSS